MMGKWVDCYGVEREMVATVGMRNAPEQNKDICEENKTNYRYYLHNIDII